MPSLVKTLQPVYSKLWDPLTPRQKFILFDFAQDGFANYKAGKDLQELMEKGLVFFDDLRLSVMTLSLGRGIPIDFSPPTGCKARRNDTAKISTNLSL